VPAAVTTGFWVVEAKLFGPVQLYVTPEVEEEPERVAVEPVLHVTAPLAEAEAPGAVLFKETSAVSLPVQPVDGSVTVSVYIPSVAADGFCTAEVKLPGPVQL
jgi:hypothetical protein